MLADIWTKTLWDQRRALVGWAIGFAAVALIYGGFYPFAATPEYAEVMEALPSGLVDAFGWDEIASPHGYLGSTVYGILGPVLVSVMAIGFGARAIAGNEEDGLLELLVAQPVTRSRVVIHRAAALLISTLMAGTITFGVIIALNAPLDMNLPIGHIAAASLNMALLGSLFGVFSLLTGSLRGRRGPAIGAGAVLAVLAFLMKGLVPQVEGLAWMEDLSPFHWADGTATLRDGFDPLSTALLAAVTVAFTTLAVVGFNRRDVGV